MLPKGIRSVIFDMDGIIIDSEPLYEESLDIALENFGVPVPPRSEYAKYKGRSGAEVFKEIADENGNRFEAKDIQLDSIKNFERLAREKVDIFPGTLEFLEFARGRYEKIGLATSSMKHIQEMIFQKFPLGQFFDAVITADDITKHKPDPEPYLVTTKLLSLSPQECMVIEDTFHGVNSSKSAGCYTVGIPNTFSEERLLAAGAHLVVKNFQELESLIQKTAS